MNQSKQSFRLCVLCKLLKGQQPFFHAIQFMDEILIFRLCIFHSAQGSFALCQLVRQFLYIILDKAFKGVVCFTQISYLCGNIRI